MSTLLPVVANIAPEAFRRVMGSFATGVAIVATSRGGEQFGLTVNSLTSVSLEPLVLLVCVARISQTAAAIRDRGRFAINLLNAEQEEVSRRFVSKEQRRFRHEHSSDNAWGVPLMAGALASLVCDVHLIQEIGDHYVVYGRVLHCEASEGRPLLYWRGAYSALRDGESLVA